MRRGFALLFVSILGPSILAACGGVSFEPDGGISGVQGGNVTDAASGLAPQNPPGPPVDYGPLSTGNTWTALYRDYFGTPQLVDGGYTGGRAACSGTDGGSCHVTSPNIGIGAQFSGFVCTGDATDAGKDDCYASLTSQMLVWKVLLNPGDPFTSDPLYAVLNISGANVSNGGLPKMPFGPPAAYPGAYVFTDEDVQRLTAWVAAGFPND